MAAHAQMNPILRKDLLSLLRLPRCTAVMMAFVVVTGAVVLAAWPQQGVVPIASAGDDNLLLGLMIGQLLLLALIMPGIAAVSVTAERENNTLDMIYSSRLTPAQIIIGKTLSVAAFPVLLIISALPFVAMLTL